MLIIQHDEMILVILKSLNQGLFVQKRTGSFSESERNVHTTQPHSVTLTEAITKEHKHHSRSAMLLVYWSKLQSLQVHQTFFFFLCLFNLQLRGQGLAGMTMKKYFSPLTVIQN